jgi:hypothetical protein
MYLAQLGAFDGVCLSINLDLKPYTRISMAELVCSKVGDLKFLNVNEKAYFPTFPIHRYKSNYQYLIHSIAGDDWAEEVGAPFDCSSLTASFFATLTCSKLRIPSRPHRPIMALSWNVEVVSQLDTFSKTNARIRTSSQGEPKRFDT